MNGGSHTLAKCLFVLGWLAVLAPAMLNDADVGVRSHIAEAVHSELVQTVRYAASLGVLAPRTPIEGR